MEVNLSGHTVTQSIKLFQDTIESNQGKIIFKVDNETVKLNLYQKAASKGYSCRSKKEGKSWLLTVQIPQKTKVMDQKESRSQDVSFPAVRKLVTEWWLIQSDQIGQRDHVLGNKLLLNLVNNLLDKPVGLYLIHRGVQLLRDPAFLEKLNHAQAQVAVCPESMAFYQLNHIKLPCKTFPDFVENTRKTKLICL